MLLLLLLVLMVCTACGLEKTALKASSDKLHEVELPVAQDCAGSESSAGFQGDFAENGLDPWLTLAAGQYEEGSLLYLHEWLADVREEKETDTADDLEIEQKARTGARYEFPIVINKKVKHFISYYSTVNSSFTRRSLKRAQLYLPEMRRILRQYHIPEELAYMVLIESGFTTHAYSRARACGPWQFISGTGRNYGLKINWWVDERRDPLKSSYAAAKYLHDLYGYFDSWYLAAAAYNAGEGKIMRAIKRHKTEDFWEMSRYRYLKRETKEYIPRLIAAILIAKEPEKYGLSDVGYLPPLTFDEVEVHDATDLQVVAWAAGCKFSALKKLNPELRYWCTPPKVKKYLVKVPSGTGEQCQQRLAGLPPEQRITFRRHRIRSGESLSTIARRYRTSIRPIKELNNLAGNMIRAGSYLVIPVRAQGSGQVVFSSRIYAAGVRQHRMPQSVIHRPSAYRVRRGDSLWKIAHKYHISVNDIRRWNGLGRSKLIKPGQILALSEQRRKRRLAKTKKRVNTASFGSGSRISTGGKTVKVRRGDSLWKIARKYHLSVNDIRRWNHLGRSKLIKPGQILLLSEQQQVAKTKKWVKTASLGSGSSTSAGGKTVKIRRGDSLWEVSRKHGLTVEQLCRWNGLKKGSILQPGQVLSLSAQ